MRRSKNSSLNFCFFFFKFHAIAAINGIIKSRKCGKTTFLYIYMIVMHLNENQGGSIHIHQCDYSYRTTSKLLLR